MEGDPVRSHAAGQVALPAAWRRGLRATAAIGLAATALGWLVAPDRVCPNVLVAAMFVLGLSLAGLVFVAFGYVTQAGWLVAIRRVPEGMAAALPVGVACVVVALLGGGVLYEWMHADAVAHDPLLQAKAPWLDTGFFVVRALVYFAAWLLFGALLLRLSRRQDETGGGTGASRALSAAFLVVFALTFSAATFDWLMSLEPHWFSTVFAIYHFSGLFLAGLATITLLTIALERLGPLRGVVKADHLHDLGQLTLGFATFWAYIWYCQHMLIWYGNIPEETVYYTVRLAGAWGPLSLLNVAVNWLIPFLVLLPRPSKRSRAVMFRIALLLLAGRWLDLYLHILPPFLEGGPAFGVWELAPLAAALPLAVLGIFRGLGRAPVVPARDPFLSESLHHHV